MSWPHTLVDPSSDGNTTSCRPQYITWVVLISHHLALLMMALGWVIRYVREWVCLILLLVMFVAQISGRQKRKERGAALLFLNRPKPETVVKVSLCVVSVVRVGLCVVGVVRVGLCVVSVVRVGLCVVGVVRVGLCVVGVVRVGVCVVGVVRVGLCVVGVVRVGVCVVGVVRVGVCVVGVVRVGLCGWCSESGTVW